MSWAFERTDRSRDRRIRVGAGGRNQVRREGRIVPAAVLRMKDHADVQDLCLQIGILTHRTEHPKDILRGRQLPDRIVQVQALLVIVTALGLIRVADDRREIAHQIHGLPQHVRQ